MKIINGFYDKKFKTEWKNYIFQSICATVAIFIVMLFLSLHQAVIVASLGATAFVVFATPSSVVAKARNVLGGYVVGILTGAVFTLIPHDGFFMTAIIYSLAVGLSIFIMVLTDTEHPPASGVTLGVVIQGFSLKVSLATLASIVILVLIHRVFRRYLKDLV